jgi:hypothetical protein
MRFKNEDIQVCKKLFVTFKFENVNIGAKKNVRVGIYGTGHFRPHNWP